jgi:hypothetical protein
VWESAIEGRPLRFHLAGINNQNFIMRDEETGSWWQQVSGKCILGPLKGSRLRQIVHDELSFGLWKSERPNGRVLRPDEQLAKADEYAPADWEARMTKVPVVTQADDQRLEPRTLVAGVSLGGKARAYPFDALLKQSPVIDTVGGIPIVVVVGDDRKSVRVFERAVDGRKLEFFARAGSTPLRLVDAETGSEWNFEGTAISGQWAGKQLQKVAVLYDYWFDWKLYNPSTDIYLLGER